MGAGVVLVLLLVGTVWGDDSAMAPQYDTIVVGLGAAGVSAASTLARAGKRVFGLDAQDRVGGRVYTVPFGEGIVELGAEWIHGTNSSRVYDAAIQNNVSVLSQDLDLKAYTYDGSHIDEQLINELILFCLQVTDEPPEKPEPLGQYIIKKLREHLREQHPEILDTNFLDEFLEFMNLLTNNYEASNDWNDVSAWSKYEELEGDQHMSWHTHGYKTFFEILLNKYNNGPGLSSLETKLNTEVTQITWPQDPNESVKVTTKDGTVYSASNVIVTVSLGVLKERYTTLFSPKLPNDKITAIETISMGLMDKIIISFPYAWWPTNKTFYAFIWSGADRRKLGDDWTMKIFGASSPMGSSKSLTLWTSGNAAKLVETLPEDVVKRKCMELLRKFMGVNTTIPEPTAMLRSTWYSNPYTRGSYTYDNLLVAQHPTTRTDLAAPLADSAGKPRVLFAGEATNELHFSTVHGASETGYREAMRLLGSSKI